MRKLSLFAAALIAAGCGTTNTPVPPGTSTTATSTSAGATSAGATTSGDTGTAGAASTTAGATSGATSTTTSSGAGTTVAGGVSIGGLSSSGTSGTTATASTTASSTTSTSGATSTSTSGTSGATSTSTSGTSGAGVCAGLVPPAPGAAVSYSIAPAQQSCGDADSDGSGTLYLEHYDNLTERVDLVSPSGAHLATAQGGKYTIQPDAQLSGLLGLAQGEGSAALDHIAPDGTLTMAAGGFGAAMQVNDPIGGVVIWDNGQNSGDMALHAFDANGAERWKISFAPPSSVFVNALGVDRQGDILLLHNEPTGLFGFWVDHSGARGQDFLVLTSDEISALGYSSIRYTLTPQVGSGLFLRAGSDIGQNPDPGSKWIRSIGSLSTTVEPAPVWLATRGGTELQLIHGGTAYAFTSLQTHLASCTQQVEIVAADGTSCGSESFTLGTGACDPKPLKVGYDGTVIQPLPEAMETCAAQYQCSCTWHWWPSYFH